MAPHAPEWRKLSWRSQRKDAETAGEATERHVRGKKVPNTVDLTPKASDTPSATRARTARGGHPQLR